MSLETRSVCPRLRRTNASRMRLAISTTPRSRCPPPRWKLNSPNSGLNRSGHAARSATANPKTQEMMRFRRLMLRRRNRIEAVTSRAAAKAPPISLSATSLTRGGLPRRCPRRLRQDDVRNRSVPIAFDHAEHRLDERLRKRVRLQPEIEKFRVLGVVVVLLGLDTRIFEMVHAHGES